MVSLCLNVFIVHNTFSVILIAHNHTKQPPTQKLHKILDLDGDPQYPFFSTCVNTFFSITLVTRKQTNKKNADDHINFSVGEDNNVFKMVVILSGLSYCSGAVYHTTIGARDTHWQWRLYWYFHAIVKWTQRPETDFLTYKETIISGNTTPCQLLEQPFPINIPYHSNATSNSLMPHDVVIFVNIGPDNNPK